MLGLPWLDCTRPGPDEQECYSQDTLLYGGGCERCLQASLSITSPSSTALSQTHTSSTWSSPIGTFGRHYYEKVAKKFCRKLLQNLMYVPWVIIFDKLKSYGATTRERLPGLEHRKVHKCAKHSHQPTH